ncbi:hypothetical protein B0H14DRAFT_2748668, partial [Mycena olivaceomarginata]
MSSVRRGHNVCHYILSLLLGIQSRAAIIATFNSFAPISRPCQLELTRALLCSPPSPPRRPPSAARLPYLHPQTL